MWLDADPGGGLDALARRQDRALAHESLKDHRKDQAQGQDRQRADEPELLEQAHLSHPSTPGCAAAEARSPLVLFSAVPPGITSTSLCVDAFPSIPLRNRCSGRVR